MAGTKFQVFEWKIENLSCWCEAVHGKCIASPDFFESPLRRVELYPRGDSGLDDRMKVRFCNVERDLSGELAFVCSDGSLIYSQQLNITQKGKRVPGPPLDLKFEEVVAKIGKEKDQITLRFCFRSDKDYEQRMCSTISVWKVSYKINPKVTENCGSDESKLLSYFRLNSKAREGMFLRIARQNERIQLIMKSYFWKKENRAVLVETSTSMQSNNDNGLVRNEMVKHVFFHDDETWTFSESLTVKEVEEEGISILLRLKVINGEIVEGHNFDIVCDEKVNIVPNDSEICFLTPKSVGVSSNQSDDSVKVLTRDFMCLYQDQDFSDVQLKCDDVTFPVHRNILSARSPVFKTMLSTDMTEASSNEVDIGDLDPSTLGLFLAYLYTGAVQEELQSEGALKLYYAADKYLVPSLKRVCDKMSISNFCDVLTLADKHKDDDLIVVSHNFILNNYNVVLGSKEWANFMEIEPLLAVKTVTRFAQNKFVGKLPIP